MRTPEDVVQFYKLYYPSLPDVLVQALSDYLTRGVRGEIELPPDFRAKPTRRAASKNKKAGGEAQANDQDPQSKELVEVVDPHTKQVYTFEPNYDRRWDYREEIER